MAKFSSNPGKVNYEGLVYLLRYISDNKIQGLKYYADMKDEPLSELFRSSNFNTENQFMASLIIVGNIVQALAKVQEHILYRYGL